MRAEAESQRPWFSVIVSLVIAYKTILETSIDAGYEIPPMEFGMQWPQIPEELEFLTGGGSGQSLKERETAMKE